MNFWRLVSPDQITNPVLTGHHNHLLMLAATLLAIMAAWVLLPVVDRYQAIRGRQRYLWLAAGSLAMGVGIWGMHFTSMLVYRLPFAIEYDPAITVLSILPAMLASATSIVFYVSAQHSALRLQQAALCMAIGIGAMHYLGMEAIGVPARMYYVPSYFFLSILAAWLLAWFGLYARIYLSRIDRLPRYIGLLAGSVILGLAVSSMHHIAMRATYFVSAPEHAAALLDGAVNMAHGALTAVDGEDRHLGLVGGIATSTLLLMTMIFLGSQADRRMSSMASSLHDSELRFQRLAESTQMAIFTFDRERITYANPALSRITGHGQFDLLSRPLVSIFNEEFGDLARDLFDSDSRGDQARHSLFEIETSKGENRWLYFSLTLMEQDREPCCLASAFDVTEQKQAELSLRKLAYTDQLTSLGNRTLFIDRLQHHMDLQARRKAEAVSCVMLMDLDNFKTINDTYGHLFGDLLLQATAERLAPLARHCDTIARLGGDEFVLMFEEMDSEHNIQLIADRILRNFREPILLEGREIQVNTSIGIVNLASRDYSTPDQVLHDADIALYRAKDEGRSCWKLYDHEIDAKVKRSRMLQKDLVDALRDDSLQLYYQPIFSAGAHRLQGFEALARWRHPGGEWISPGEFIPLAEENGLISRINLWSLDAVCRQIAAWRRDVDTDGYFISLNVTADAFNDGSFLRDLADKLQRYEIPRGQLKLELTESMLLIDDERILEKLERMIALGCELAIDDFGTGYSALSYLHRLPVSTLKIDRSFVASMGSDSNSRSVVTTIIALAKSLSMHVISEGVETREQAELLLQMGSDSLQGFYLGKPAAPEHGLQLLLEDKVCDMLPKAGNFS